MLWSLCNGAIYHGYTGALYHGYAGPVVQALILTSSQLQNTPLEAGKCDPLIAFHGGNCCDSQGVDNENNSRYVCLTKG